ncbi:hypothetical protein M404DRAFT_999777 [Pisolithus tinctorius Marx 270]|uniref:Uncharacterized protein n=1 Tax=Pisolithus tinctorius Marx 270 TaxID=870435 RepID=A0A0C3PCA2_PISTI|nr:hypothetical protein M404DRAFT_999777 [Pisolithus tinctorius Marx 270]
MHKGGGFRCGPNILIAHFGVYVEPVSPLWHPQPEDPVQPSRGPSYFAGHEVSSPVFENDS